MSSDSDFWLKVAGAAFGVWAFMIPLGIWLLKQVFNDVLDSIRTSSAEVAKFREEFKTYIIAMEHRVTALEERDKK